MHRLTYVGHSTVLVELDGTTILTDPLLRNRVAHLRRGHPLPENVPDPDAVLISHGHYDHLDLPSLRRLPRSTKVVVPRGLGSHVDRFDVLEVEEGDEFEIGSLTVRATRAEHEGGHWPRHRGLPLGYAILGSSRIFFAGDTDLFDTMDGLVPDLDVALIPIWGWGPSLGRGKHLDPIRAAEAVRRLRPKLAIPIHWGTYRPLHLSALSGFLTRPTGMFERATADAAPDVEVRVLQPGEQLGLQ